MEKDKNCHGCEYWHLGAMYSKPEIICNNEGSPDYGERTAPGHCCDCFKERRKTDGQS